MNVNDIIDSAWVILLQFPLMRVLLPESEGHQGLSAALRALLGDLTFLNFLSLYRPLSAFVSIFMSTCLSVRSPVDEEGVHDSFNQLIAEQSQNGGPSEAFELQQLQRDLDEEGRGTQQSPQIWESVNIVI